MVVGTSEYSNVLYGKLQRAAALWGTNLRDPAAIVCPGDNPQKLKQCLWTQFYMASPGAGGTISQKEVMEDYSTLNFPETILFFDAASPKQESLLSKLPFFNNGNNNNNNNQDPSIPAINQELLYCAAERGCAHVYVLCSIEALESCWYALEPYNGYVASTIIALDKGVSLQSTPGWTTSRPQNMDGEFVGAVALRGYNGDDPTYFGGATLPVEDAAEVMLHVALRTDRTFSEYPRIVQIAPSNDSVMVERLNADYFTMTGGPIAQERAGTVKSVASWAAFLAPFGQVYTELGKRPDQS